MTRPPDGHALGMWWTALGIAVTLAAWLATWWGRAVSVRFQAIAEGTAIRLTVGTGSVRGHQLVTAPLQLPQWTSLKPSRDRQSPGSGGPNWLLGFHHALVRLSRTAPGGRLWTRGTVYAADAAVGAVAVGAGQAALGWWYTRHLVPLEVRHLRVGWELGATRWQLAGRMGGIFRMKTGDIILAALWGIGHLRPAKTREAK